MSPRRHGKIDNANTPRRPKRKGKGKTAVQHIPVIQPNVAGIDLSATTHFVCGPSTGENQAPNVAVFGATTPQLMELAQWLKEQGVESVAMESTSVYWIPVYEILEQSGFDVQLVNARELSRVPGRKSDYQDCQWIQLLHSCGLLNGSFRPKDEICRLRALQREAANVVEMCTQSIQGMQKALDQMNVLVHRAVTDITGVTGMGIIRAIVAGERDPRVLAELRDKRCKKSVQEIVEYLTGNWRVEHLFNLEMALVTYDHLCEQLAKYDEKIREEIAALVPEEYRGQTPPPLANMAKAKKMARTGDDLIRDLFYQLAGKDLTSIDGISIHTTQVVFTEVGPDISAFPSEGQWVSWLRLSGHRPSSGGKPLKKKRYRSGANRIAASLRMGASSLERSKSALGAEFRRLARRKGKGVAVFAVARHLAQLVYRMLRYGKDYVDIGAKAYEERFAQRRLQHLERQAMEMGFDLVQKETTPA